MAIIVPNQGETRMITSILSSENLILKLYNNDYVPTETDTPSSFTEVSGYGYSAITVPFANWTIVSGAPSTATTAENVFSFTGNAGAVYGYYLIGASSGTLYWAERFNPGPIYMQNSGDQIRIALSFGLD